MELSDLHSAAWGVFSAQPGPVVTFATFGPEGPEMRSVVLRSAEAGLGTISFFTDLSSPKVAHLRADGRAGVHLWDRGAALHLRATGIARVTRGPDAAWARMDADQRRNYGVSPPPGTPIPCPDAYEKPSSFAAFGQITLIVNTLEVLHMTEPHARAEFRRTDRWAGQWIAP